MEILASADFETLWGDFANAIGDDYDWTRHFDYTPSGETGPSAGANGSTYYAYMETSDDQGAYIAGDTVFLESIDINGNNRQLTFYYHMYGEDIGTLNVDVFNDGSWTNSVWSISGQQHASGTDAYTQAIVDLSSYNSTIRVRFRGVAIGGDRGDMSIDQVEIRGVGIGFDGDNDIDLADFAILSSAWLSDDTPTANWNISCDLDNSGDIGIGDLIIFSEYWLVGK